MSLIQEKRKHLNAFYCIVDEEVNDHSFAEESTLLENPRQTTAKKKKYCDTEDQSNIVNSKVHKKKGKKEKDSFEEETTLLENLRQTTAKKKKYCDTEDQSNIVNSQVHKKKGKKEKDSFEEETTLLENPRQTTAKKRKHCETEDQSNIVNSKVQKKKVKKEKGSFAEETSLAEPRQIKAKKRKHCETEDRSNIVSPKVKKKEKKKKCDRWELAKKSHQRDGCQDKTLIPQNDINDSKKRSSDEKKRHKDTMTQKMQSSDATESAAEAMKKRQKAKKQKKHISDKTECDVMVQARHEKDDNVKSEKKRKSKIPTTADQTKSNEVPEMLEISESFVQERKKPKISKKVKQLEVYDDSYILKGNVNACESSLENAESIHEKKKKWKKKHRQALYDNEVNMDSSDIFDGNGVYVPQSSDVGKSNGFRRIASNDNVQNHSSSVNINPTKGKNHKKEKKRHKVEKFVEDPTKRKEHKKEKKRKKAKKSVKDLKVLSVSVKEPKKKHKTKIENLSPEEYLDYIQEKLAPLKECKTLIWPINPLHWNNANSSSRTCSSSCSYHMQQLKKCGIDFVLQTGNFTKEEDQLLKKNFENFVELHKIQEPLALLFPEHRMEGSSKRWRAFGRKANFLLHLGQGINRTLHAIFIRAQNLMSPDILFKGSLSQEEKDQLVFLVEKYKNAPSKWKKIEKIMGRNSLSLYQCYDNIANRQIIGYWSQEESDMLIEAVKNVCNVHDISTTLHQKLPWTKIYASKQIPGRTAHQCISHWTTILKRHQKLNQPKWREDLDDIKLISRLYEISITAASEDDVDWEELCQEFPESPPATFIQSKFHELKSTMPGYVYKTFDEIVDYLYYNVIPDLMKDSNSK